MLAITYMMRLRNIAPCFMVTERIGEKMTDDFREQFRDWLIERFTQRDFDMVLEYSDALYEPLWTKIPRPGQQIPDPEWFGLTVGELRRKKLLNKAFFDKLRDERSEWTPELNGAEAACAVDKPRRADLRAFEDLLRAMFTARQLHQIVDWFFEGKGLDIVNPEMPVGTRSWFETAVRIIVDTNYVTGLLFALLREERKNCIDEINILEALARQEGLLVERTQSTVGSRTSHPIEPRHLRMVKNLDGKWGYARGRIEILDIEGGVAENSVHTLHLQKDAQNSVTLTLDGSITSTIQVDGALLLSAHKELGALPRGDSRFLDHAHTLSEVLLSGLAAPLTKLPKGSRLEIVDDGGVLLWVPWEALILPGEGLLGIHLSVARIMGSDGGECSAKKPALIGLVDYNQEFGQTYDEEFVRLQSLSADGHVTLLEGPVGARQAFSGSTTASLVHISCHGHANTGTAFGAMLQFYSQTFPMAQRAASDTTGILPEGAVRLGSMQGALVFLNACQGAVASNSLHGASGWGRRFLNAGAVAVVATSWSVRVDVARGVAVAFYDCLKQGDTLEEALRRARETYTASDHDALAYGLYIKQGTRFVL